MTHTPDESEPLEPPRPSLQRRAWDRFVYLVWEQMMKTEHPAWERFFARRCPHLAGMIAYFGILSIIPAAFLLFSTLALAGALDSQGWIVEQVQAAIPGEGANTIVRTVESLRENSGSLGVIGVVGLVWATSNFFSCIESALNIIYGVNNRHFLFQKAWVLFLMLAALLAVTLATLLVAVALPLLHELEAKTSDTFNMPIEDGLVTLLISFSFAFMFFISCYRFLPNVAISTREVWRGALIATLAFEGSIRLMPAWVGADRGGIVISAFAGAFIVLIWFYVVAFILLVGGVYNWWWREKRRRAAAQLQFGGA
ncbi:MAG: YihY/virulence factor BrkB family protein [Gaiellales bacterium]